jgi:hypothetical protein
MGSGTRSSDVRLHRREQLVEPLEVFVPTLRHAVLDIASRASTVWNSVEVGERGVADLLEADRVELDAQALLELNV